MEQYKLKKKKQGKISNKRLIFLLFNQQTPVYVKIYLNSKKKGFIKYLLKWLVHFDWYVLMYTPVKVSMLIPVLCILNNIYMNKIIPIFMVKNLFTTSFSLCWEIRQFYLSLYRQKAIFFLPSMYKKNK